MASNIRNLGFIIILLMVLLTTALVVSWSTEKALAKQVVTLTPLISLSLEHDDWMVNTWCEISLAYSHWNRDANVPDYEYQDNRLLLSLTFAKGFVW